MKNKILTFLCVIALLVLGAISKLLPLKCADLANTQFTFRDNTYYFLGLDKIDIDALGGQDWTIANIYINNSVLFGEDVIITCTAKRTYDIQNNNNQYINVDNAVQLYLITFEIKNDSGQIYDTHTYSIDYEQGDFIQKHFILIYNYVDIINPGTNKIYVGYGDLTGDYSKFVDSINLNDIELQYYKTTQPYIELQLNNYNYMFNDYCEVQGYYQGDSPTLTEIRTALIDRINYFYENGPFYGKYFSAYQRGYDLGKLNPITRDWISTIFDKITAFLNIQILPNLTFGTLLAIPLVLCLLKLVLFIWRNEG